MRTCCTGKKHQFGVPGQAGPVTSEVYQKLVGIQTKQLEDPHGWVYTLE
jgi:hypothetical protein